MTNFDNILSLFPDPELSARVEDILRATEVIANKEPVYGFHHKFYVPGWIGVIQQQIVQNKMDKFSTQPYYLDKNYFQYADWLIEQSKEMADLLMRSKPEGDEENEDYNKQCNALIKLFNLAFDCWIDSCPEIATYCNREYTENTLISPAGIVQNAFKESLGPIGYKTTSPKSGRKFVDEVKGFFYMIASYIINLMLLAAIFGLGSLIFG